MEKPVTIAETPAIRLVEKPKSNWMSLLNGAGNGAMIGGSTLIANNIYEHLKGIKGDKPSKLYIGATAITGICTAIGAVYGLKEAHQVNEYRNALAKDIETLHAKVDGLEAAPSR